MCPLFQQSAANRWKHFSMGITKSCLLTHSAPRSNIVVTLASFCPVTRNVCVKEMATGAPRHRTAKQKVGFFLILWWFFLLEIMKYIIATYAITRYRRNAHVSDMIFFLMKEKSPVIWHGHKYGCWCPGDARSQCIGSHGIGLSFLRYFGFRNRGITISVGVY